MSDELDGIKVTLPPEVCKTCWGRRKIITPDSIITCPDCGRDHLSPGYEGKHDTDIDLLIPEPFRDIIFNSGILLDDPTIPKEVRNSEEFLTYTKYLNKIVYAACNGALPSTSLFIAAPPGFGKNHAVYAAMQGAARFGKKVAPYYDAGELMRLDGLGKLGEDYYGADYAFVKINAGNVEVRDLQAAKLITERRARRNKPTIVTSRMPRGYFKKMEPSIVELIRDQIDLGDKKTDYFRWRYVASKFIYYEGKR